MKCLGNFEKKKFRTIGQSKNLKDFDYFVNVLKNRKRT